MRWYQLALLGLLLTSRETLAQTSFNRWEARPVVKPTPATSGKQRASETTKAKARQDSLRIVANAAEVPSLRRGIGQRMKEGQMIAEDIRHHEYMSKSFHYPSEALRAETEGRITLRLAVNPTGQVVSITSTENTIPAGAVGRENMVQQVYFLMRQLKFEPAATTTDEEFVFTYKYE